MMTSNNDNEIVGDSIKEMEVVKIRKLFEEVFDPEIPVLSIIDLGIVRNIHLYPVPGESGWEGTVVITPTYSGCPAMDAMSMDIRLKLIEHGYKNIKVTSVLSPAWTTDWMSEAGKEKLKAYGIAPPHPKQIVCETKLFAESEAIQCPACNSYHTNLISRFGSTACKALYQCQECKEPFDYFKCH
ncbi:MAG: 1,2-phenylacetyl-CoA epoxidase subunit PaaD [Ferruginibacter sp.]